MILARTPKKCDEKKEKREEKKLFKN